MLFVDLVKEGKEERFHFNEYFENQFFHWESQTTQKQDDLQKHVSQRFLVHYSVGFLAKFFNLEPTLIFKIFSIVFYMLI